MSSLGDKDYTESFRWVTLENWCMWALHFEWMIVNNLGVTVTSKTPDPAQFKHDYIHSTLRV